MKRAFIHACLGLLFIIAVLMPSQQASGLPYGAGTYGTCQYDTCSISITSNNLVSVNITPVGGATKCTVASDTVTVTTGSSTGYSLTLSATNATNDLSGSTNVIAATSGTPAVPAALSANTWGFRVDGLSGFGAGPTSAVSSVSIPSATFAGVPVFASPTTIASTAAPAAAVATNVWYGACADTSIPADTYTDVVLYTAIVNL